jgi:hypothetical protein
MRGESRIALLALGLGLAPILIKKSKPFARYVGDHLIKAGEYIKLGMEEDPINAESKPPVVKEEPVEVIVEEIAVVDEAGEVVAVEEIVITEEGGEVVAVEEVVIFEEPAPEEAEAPTEPNPILEEQTSDEPANDE